MVIEPVAAGPVVAVTVVEVCADAGSAASAPNATAIRKRFMLPPPGALHAPAAQRPLGIAVPNAKLLYGKKNFRGSTQVQRPFRRSPAGPGPPAPARHAARLAGGGDLARSGPPRRAGSPPTRRPRAPRGGRARGTARPRRLRPARPAPSRSNRA